MSLTIAEIISTHRLSTKQTNKKLYTWALSWENLAFFLPGLVLRKPGLVFKKPGLVLRKPISRVSAGFPQIIKSKIPWLFPKFSLAKFKFPWPKISAFVKLCVWSLSMISDQTAIPSKCSSILLVQFIILSSKLLSWSFVFWWSTTNNIAKMPRTTTRKQSVVQMRCY